MNGNRQLKSLPQAEIGVGLIAIYSAQTSRKQEEFKHHTCISLVRICSGGKKVEADFRPSILEMGLDIRAFLAAMLKSWECIKIPGGEQDSG
jgi:hypothetical protein